MAFIGKVLGISGKTVEARFLQRWQRLRLGRGSGPSSTPQSLTLPAKACCDAGTSFTQPRAADDVDPTGIGPDRE